MKFGRCAAQAMPDEEVVLQNPGKPLERSKRAPSLINLPPVVLVLIGLLVALHGVLVLGGENWQIWAIAVFSFNPARFGSDAFWRVPGSRWWSMLTYGLLHADWTHVLFNCLWLAVFSKPVAMRLGTLRYLILVGVCVIAGALGALVMHWGQNYAMVGISAGVSGLLAAAIPLIYARNADIGLGSEIGMEYLKPLRPLEIIRNGRAMAFTAMWLGLTVITAASQYITGTAFLEERPIAWEAHLAGFVVGFVAFYLLDPRKVPRAIVM
jgi:membrane associated rhomboid family serine protease